jgi:hypothetical protein
MTAKTTKSPVLAIRNAIVCCVAASALVPLAACDKGSDAGSAAASTATGAAATAAAGAKPKATLKLADMKAAYKSEIDNMAKMKDPMPKKIDAFVAKVGNPSSDDGRRKTWFALDGDNCSKVVIDTTDGSITDSTTAKSDCGM